MTIRKSKKDILNGNVLEQIIIFTIPLIGSYLLQQLYKIADSLVLGRCVGKSALAAIGTSTSIINVILNFISGICTGTMILVAQSYGSKNPEKVKKSVKTGFFIAFVLGAILTVALALFTEPILVMTGCPDDAMEYSITYLKIYGYSFIPYLIFSIGRFILVATGDSKRSLMFTIIIAVVKISLDLLLTGVLKLGILGVSLATFVAHLVCAIVVIIIFKNTSEIYQYSIKEFGVDKDSLIQINKIGLPVAIQSTLFALTGLIVQTKLNAYGTDTIAAYSAYGDVDNIYWSFANGLSSAAVTLIGQNYGNNNIRRVYEFVRKCIYVQIVMSIVICGIDFAFGRQMLSLYTSDSEVIEIGYQMIKAVAPYYNVYAFLEIPSCLCKGVGDATASLIICTIGICIFRIIFLSVFNFTNAVQLMYSFTFSWVLTSALYLIYILTSKKYPKIKRKA